MTGLTPRILGRQAGFFFCPREKSALHPAPAAKPSWLVAASVDRLPEAVFTAGAAAAAMGAAVQGFTGVMAAGGAVMTGGAVAGSTALGAVVAAGSAIVGSVASQLVGMAIGAQDGFSWKQVAMSGISAGVTAGVSGGLGLLAQTTTGTTSAILSNAAVRVGLASAVTQGVGVATGLQSSFNWKGVAAAAVGAEVGSMVGGQLPNPGENIFGKVANATVSGFAAGVTTAALRGGRIDVVSVATDAFGNALGSSLANGNSSSQSGAGEEVLKAAQAQTGGGFDSDAAYNPMVEAFSAPRNGYAANGPSMLLAANDITQPGQGVVMSDAGGGGDDAGYPYERSFMDSDGVVHVQASRTPFQTAPVYGIDADGQAIGGSFPVTTVRPEPESGADSFQADNDAKVNAGTYDRFSAIGDALRAGQFGQAWRHATYEASPDAREVNNARLFPAPSPAAARLNKMIDSPVGAGLSGIANLFGASQHTQDALLNTGAVAEAFWGGLAGFQMPKAPLPGAMASRIRNRPVDGNAGIQANKAAGDAWEAEVLKDVLPKTQVNIQPQITVRSNGPSGLKVRLDAVGERVDSGQAVLSDMKASATAPLTKNQKAVYPELETYGGTVVGKGKFPYVGGTQLPPSSVDIIRKPKQ